MTQLPIMIRRRRYERPLPRPPPTRHHQPSRHLLNLIVALFSPCLSRYSDSVQSFLDDNVSNSIPFFITFPGGSQITGVIGGVASQTDANSWQVTGPATTGSGTIPDNAIVTFGVGSASTEPVTPPEAVSTLKAGQAYYCYRWPGTANKRPQTADKGIFHVARRDIQPYQPLNASLELNGGTYVITGSTVSTASAHVRGICQGLSWDVDFGDLRFQVDGELYRVINAQQLARLRFLLTLQRLD